MRTEKEIKELLTWNNPDTKIEELLAELDEAKDKLSRRNMLVKDLRKQIQGLKNELLEKDPQFKV